MVQYKNILIYITSMTHSARIPKSCIYKQRQPLIVLVPSPHKLWPWYNLSRVYIFALPGFDAGHPESPNRHGDVWKDVMLCILWCMTSAHTKLIVVVFKTYSTLTLRAAVKDFKCTHRGNMCVEECVWCVGVKSFQHEYGICIADFPYTYYCVSYGFN